MDPTGITPLMQYLQAHRDDRGTMAELRCLLNRHLRPRGWQAIAPVGGIGDPVKETIAGLFATHPLNCDQPDYHFGTACRRLASCRQKTVSSESKAESPLDARFRRLLSADRLTLCSRLVDIVLGFKAENIPVNYASLAADLIYWGDRVRERWAQQYWAPTPQQRKGSDNVPQ